MICSVFAIPDHNHMNVCSPHAIKGSISHQVCSLGMHIRYTIASLHHLLNTSRKDAQPRSAEVMRRLYFFSTSLQMNMPQCQQVSSMVDFSTLVPYYAEDLIATHKEINAVKNNRMSLKFYLKTVHGWVGPAECLKYRHHSDISVYVLDGDGNVPLSQVHHEEWKNFEERGR